MQAEVYRIRELGVRRDGDVVRKECKRGELHCSTRLYNVKAAWRVMNAQLLTADGETYVIPLLDHARVLAVQGRGILIAGLEVHVLSRGAKNIKTRRYPQTWWCLHVTP